MTAIPTSQTNAGMFVLPDIFITDPQYSTMREGSTSSCAFLEPKSGPSFLRCESPLEPAPSFLSYLGIELMRVQSIPTGVWIPQLGKISRADHGQMTSVTKLPWVNSVRIWDIPAALIATILSRVSIPASSPILSTGSHPGTCQLVISIDPCFISLKCIVCSHEGLFISPVQGIYSQASRCILHEIIRALDFSNVTSLHFHDDCQVNTEDGTLPSTDDWKKLLHCMAFLKEIKINAHHMRFISGIIQALTRTVTPPLDVSVSPEKETLPCSKLQKCTIVLEFVDESNVEQAKLMELTKTCASLRGVSGCPDEKWECFYGEKLLAEHVSVKVWLFELLMVNVDI